MPHGTKDCNIWSNTNVEDKDTTISRDYFQEKPSTEETLSDGTAS